MQALSPSVDRIGAALKALRQTHGHDAQGDDKLALGAKCLHAITVQLAEEGLPSEDLQPLIDLEASLRQMIALTQTESVANRRKRLPPSESLLARASAVIDLLIKAGSDEAEAAQIFMRRLTTAGIPPPQKGGDARGWRRLLEWRTDLGNGLVSEEARQEYLNFAREIEAIPANERVRRVLDERLWDRRRKSG
ncbi:MAG: hypothetical protein MUO37_07260 [Methyloceanibacter sp.]|nr:hypothetical protein [Methyloceanibacter sp.]